MISIENGRQDWEGERERDFVEQEEEEEGETFHNFVQRRTGHYQKLLFQHRRV